MGTLEELEKRIQKLEDIEAIKKLTIRGLHLADSKYRDGKLKSEGELEEIAKEISELYSEDGTFDAGEYGVAKGKQAIYERHKTSPFNFAIHFFVMPDIEVNGDTASARWYLLESATNKDNEALWISAVEDYDYIREEGRWLLRHKKASIIFVAPYDKGWAQ